jgi:hypothetical protein
MNSRRGFSLIELMIGSFVALLAVGALLAGVGGLRTLLARSQERAICVRIAADSLDQWVHDDPAWGIAVNNTDNLVGPYATQGYQISVNYSNYPEEDPRYVAANGGTLFTRQVQYVVATVVSPHGVTVNLETLVPFQPSMGLCLAETPTGFAHPLVFFSFQDGKQMQVIDLVTHALVQHYGPMPVRPQPPPPPPYKPRPLGSQIGGLAVDQTYQNLFGADWYNGGFVPAQTPNTGATGTWPTSPYYNIDSNNNGLSASNMWMSANMSIIWAARGAQKSIYSWVPPGGAASHDQYPMEPLSPLGTVNNVGADPAGANIWITDVDNLCLRHFVPGSGPYNALGTWSDQIKFGNPNNGPTGATAMGMPRAVAVGLTGNVYTVDALNLYQFVPSTNTLTTFALPPQAQCAVCNMTCNRVAMTGAGFVGDVLVFGTLDYHLWQFSNGAFLPAPIY